MGSVVQVAQRRAPLLVGRSEEIALLAEFWGSLSDGATAVLLHGEAGIGKTSLWLHGIRGAPPEATVLVSRPAEMDRQVAYSGLAGLFDELDEHELRLGPNARRALRQAVRRQDRQGPVHASEVANAAVELVSELVTSGPVLLAVDDAPWWDPSTTRVVSYVMRRLSTRPIGLLACQRGEGFAGALPATLPPDRVTRVHVTGLSEQEVGEVIEGRLGAKLLRPMLARIHAVSGGNPFYALELARSVLSVPGPAATSGPLPVSETLAELVGRRLAALPASTNEVLLVVAMAEPAAVELVEGVVGQRARSAIARGLDAGVLRLEAGRVRFSHPVLAETTYARADPSRRRHLHLALAETADDVEVRARHLAATGVLLPDAKVAAVLEEAGRAACGRGAPDAGAELLARSVDLTPVADVVDRQRRALETARQLAGIGQTDRSERLLRELAAELAPGPRRARVLQQISAIERSVGSWSRTLDSLQQAKSEAAPDFALQAELANELAVATMQAGNLRQASVHVREALDLVDSIHDRAGTTIPEDTVAYIKVIDLVQRVASGQPPRPGQSTQLIRLATAALDSGRTELNTTLRVVGAAATLKWLDEFDAARQLLERLRGTLWERHEDGLLMPVLFQLSELECWSGRVERAAELADLATQTYQRAAQPTMGSMARYTQALLAVRTGNLEIARTTATRCLTEATRAEDVRNQLRALTVLGFTELSGGRSEQAVEPLAHAWRLERDLGYGNPAVIRGAPDHIEALANTGACDEARRCLRTLDAQASLTENPWVQSVAARSRGVVAAASGDLVAALAELEAAAKRPTADPLDRGRALLWLAIVSRRVNRRASARGAAESARSIFSTVQAHTWRARAETELARLEGVSGAADGLTPTESEIATLIGRGLSNKEIAADLHVSVKTVEAHLTHIYRKLGLHSRTQLAATRAQDAPGSPTSRETPNAGSPNKTYAQGHDDPPHRRQP